MLRIIVLLAAIIIASGVATAQSGNSAVPPPAIRVTGTATVASNPDLAQIYVAVITRDPLAMNAAAENARIVTNVLTAVRAQLASGSSVATVSYTLDPNYVYPKEGGEPRLDGYIAQNMLKIEVADLNKVGAIIDAAISAGANKVTGLNYTLRSQTKMRSEALGNAARDARAKADALAAASGVRIIGIRLIEETSVFMPQRGDMMKADFSTPTPIVTGPVEVRADVSITFDIAG